MGGRGRPRAPWCPTRRCTLFSQIREWPRQLPPAAGDLLPLQGCQQLVDCKGPREVSTGPGTPHLGPGLLSVHAPSAKPWDRLCAGQPAVQDLGAQHLLQVLPGVSRLSPPRGLPPLPAALQTPAFLPSSPPPVPASPVGSAVRVSVSPISLFPRLPPRYPTAPPGVRSGSCSNTSLSSELHGP